MLAQVKAHQGISIVHINYLGIAPASADMVNEQTHELTDTNST
jgi:hypothetical protein